jgi:hypothetical protein
MPGELASVHGPLAERCEACHPTGIESVKLPLHGLAATRAARAQSERCLDCHAPGDAAFAAHGRPAAPASNRLDLAAARAAGVPGAREGAFDCATCHHEHRGAGARLARLDDARCQACHAERFGSFAVGHPGVSGYGRSRTAIAFDHASHVERHFPASDAPPAACTDCHVPDERREHLLVRPFEASCGACHADDVAGASRAGGPGLPVLALPGVDTLSLDDAGFGVGRWPADAALVETELPPIAALLLGGDAGAADELLDLEDEDVATIESASRLVWAYKRLLAELAGGGHEALRGRIAAGLGREVTPGEAAELLMHLPGELLADALATWLPDLDQELARRTAGGRAAPSELGPGGDLERDPAREAWVSGGGWYRQEADWTLRYRPAGHADAFLRAWIDATAGAAPGTAAARVFAELTSEGAVGACAKCHRTDAGDGGPPRWEAGPVPAHGLTRFSHAPHLVGLGEEGCLACHAVEAEPAGSDGPGLGAIDVASCASCHSARGASDGCLTCHRYHERTTPLSLPRAPLPPLGSAPVGLAPGLASGRPARTAPAAR